MGLGGRYGDEKWKTYPTFGMRLRATIGRTVPPMPDPTATKPYACGLFSRTSIPWSYYQAEADGLSICDAYSSALPQEATVQTKILTLSTSQEQNVINIWTPSLNHKYVLRDQPPGLG